MTLEEQLAITQRHLQALQLRRAIVCKELSHLYAEVSVSAEKHDQPELAAALNARAAYNEKEGEKCKAEYRQLRRELRMA